MILAMEMTLPKIFEGKDSCPLYIASPASVRKLRGFWSNLISFFLVLLGLPFFLILFWPAGIVFGIVDIYCLKKALGAFVLSRSGEVKEGHCPECGLLMNIWTAAAVHCPRCRKKLMKHGDRIYSVE